MSVCAPDPPVEGACYGCWEACGDLYWLNEAQGVVYEVCWECWLAWDDRQAGRCEICHKHKARKDLYAEGSGGAEVGVCKRCYNRLPPLEAEA